MTTERLSMRQTREILRQKWNLGRTHREVGYTSVTRQLAHGRSSHVRVVASRTRHVRRPQPLHCVLSARMRELT
jgi:hypothetical protein